jgi:RNA polymerase sigma-70 factor (ECF subfamily)
MNGQKQGENLDSFGINLIRMQEHLYYYALQLTENREDALDLVQETSYKALRNKNRLHNHEHIRAWLYTILRNTYINYLRSSHFKQLVFDSDELVSYSDSGEYGNSPLPDDILAREELRSMVDSLPMAYGKPIRLMLSGYSYKEIASRMGIPIGTVKSRIHLGKKRISKVYLA